MSTGPGPLIARKGFDLRRFNQISVLFLLCLGLTCSVSVWFTYDTFTHYTTNNIVIVGTVWILTLCLCMYTLASLRGFYVWTRGSLPLQKDPDAKYIMSEDGRMIEYFTYGSQNDDATILVMLHGSGSTGKFFNQFVCQDEALQELNVRAISPSYPGHGGSDVDMFRRIADWPYTDLEPILKHECIDKFYVVGTSYGTSHGMAVATAFPKRVLGLGLIAPYLPEPICREVNMWTDADMIFREKQLQQPYVLLPLIGIFFLADLFIESGIKSGYVEGKKMATVCPGLAKVLVDDAHRSFMRGVNGQIFEMLNAETTQIWPDPRKIEINNIAVWYADDDSIVRPECGQWLGNNLGGGGERTKGRNLDIRTDKIGLGHFTWLVPPSCETAAIVRTLIGNTK